VPSSPIGGRARIPLKDTLSDFLVFLGPGGREHRREKGLLLYLVQSAEIAHTEETDVRDRGVSYYQVTTLAGLRKK